MVEESEFKRWFEESGLMEVADMLEHGMDSVIEVYAESRALEREQASMLKVLGFVQSGVLIFDRPNGKNEYFWWHRTNDEVYGLDMESCVDWVSAQESAPSASTNIKETQQ